MSRICDFQRHSVRNNVWRRGWGVRLGPSVGKTKRKVASVGNMPYVFGIQTTRIQDISVFCIEKHFKTTSWFPTKCCFPSIQEKYRIWKAEQTDSPTHTFCFENEVHRKGKMKHCYGLLFVDFGSPEQFGPFSGICSRINVCWFPIPLQVSFFNKHAFRGRQPYLSKISIFLKNREFIDGTN